MAISVQAQNGMGKHIVELTPNENVESLKVNLTKSTFVQSLTVDTGVLGKHLALLSSPCLHKNIYTCPVPSHISYTTFPHHVLYYAGYRHSVRDLGLVRECLFMLPCQLLLGQVDSGREVLESVRDMVYKCEHEYRSGRYYFVSSYACLEETRDSEAAEAGTYDDLCSRWSVSTPSFYTQHINTNLAPASASYLSSASTPS